MRHETASGLIYDSSGGVLALKLQQFALFRPVAWQWELLYHDVDGPLLERILHKLNGRLHLGEIDARRVDTDDTFVKALGNSLELGSLDLHEGASDDRQNLAHQLHRCSKVLRLHHTKHGDRQLSRELFNPLWAPQRGHH